MKTKAPFLTAAVLSLAVLTACGEKPADNNAVGAEDVGPAPADAAVTPPPAAPMPPADATAAGPVSEPDALGLIVVVNEHEVAAADQAIGKNVSAPVRAYADMMRSEHTSNMEQARAIDGMTVGTGPEVAALRTKTEAKRTELAAMEGTAFERAYVEAMIQDHQEVLTMLDQRLIPAAQNPAVKEYLTATRDAVAKHLEAARELQTQLGAAPAAS